MAEGPLHTHCLGEEQGLAGPPRVLQTMFRLKEILTGHFAELLCPGM